MPVTCLTYNHRCCLCQLISRWGYFVSACFNKFHAHVWWNNRSNKIWKHFDFFSEVSNKNPQQFSSWYNNVQLLSQNSQHQHAMFGHLNWALQDFGEPRHSRCFFSEVGISGKKNHQTMLWSHTFGSSFMDNIFNDDSTPPIDLGQWGFKPQKTTKLSFALGSSPENVHLNKMDDESNMFENDHPNYPNYDSMRKHLTGTTNAKSSGSPPHSPERDILRSNDFFRVQRCISL